MLQRDSGSLIQLHSESSSKRSESSKENRSPSSHSNICWAVREQRGGSQGLEEEIQEEEEEEQEEEEEEEAEKRPEE